MKLVFSIILFNLNFGFSQINNTVESPDFTRSKSESFNGFIGETDLAIFTIDYIYSSKKKKELIARKFFKSDLVLMQETNIFKSPLDGYYSEPYEVYFINDKLYLFSIFTHIKEQTTTLGLFIFSESLKLQQFEIVDSIANVNQTNIIIKPSHDKKALIIVQSHPHSNTRKQVVDLNCLNLSGQSVWKKELISFNTVSKINIESIEFPTNKEIYILCNYGFNTVNSQNNQVKLLTNKYTLWVYNHSLNFLKEVDLKLKLKWINGVDIKLKPNGNLIVAGYVNSTRDFAIDAFFNIELNKKYEVINNNYYKFSKEEVQLFLLKGSKKKQLNNYYLRELIILNDGSFYLLGEHFDTYLDRVFDPRTNTTRTVEHFNYDYIISAYFDSLGHCSWIKRIPKIQNSTNDGGYYSSFSVFSKESEVYLVYNDHEKNIDYISDDLEYLKAMFNNKHSAITQVTIQTNGNIKKQHLSPKSRYYLYAKKSKSINTETMYLLLESGRKAKILGLDL